MLCGRGGAVPQAYTIDWAYDGGATASPVFVVYADYIRCRRGRKWYDVGAVPMGPFKDALLSWISGTKPGARGDRMLAGGPTGEAPACDAWECVPAFVERDKAPALERAARERVAVIVEEMQAADRRREARRKARGISNPAPTPNAEVEAP